MTPRIAATLLAILLPAGRPRALPPQIAPGGLDAQEPARFMDPDRAVKVKATAKVVDATYEKYAKDLPCVYEVIKDNQLKLYVKYVHLWAEEEEIVKKFQVTKEKPSPMWSYSKYREILVIVSSLLRSSSQRSESTTITSCS